MILLSDHMTPRQLGMWRRRHGHTLRTGAESLGVHKSTFAQWLAGTRAVPATAAMLAAAIDILVEEQHSTRKRERPT